MALTHRMLLALLLSTASLARAEPLAQTASPSMLAIIVHHSNPVDNLTLSELRRIFMLDTQTWPHGRKITVVLREKGQRERVDAIRIICRLSAEDYERHILFRTFQGSVNIGPRSILSASAMLRFVYSAPGAIGAIAADQVDASVKVVSVDGALPGDPRYPLRSAPRSAADDRR